MRSSVRSRLAHPRSAAAAAVAVVVLAGPITASPAAAAVADGWVGTWTTAQQPPTGATWQGPNWSQTGFEDHSVRQVVRVSTGGARLRIRLSNAYGQAPLRLTGATVGRTAAGAAVRPGTLRPLRFGGSPAATVPVGEEKASDAVPLAVAPLERLTVTLYFADPTGPATFHEFAAATVYRGSGDHRFDHGAAAYPETGRSWYYLAGIDVTGPAANSAYAMVAVGDSITDGVGSTVDADNRYPDELAERFVAAGRKVGVLNAGIGGNRILNDSTCYGERAPLRFRRDALDQPGARTVVVLEGINDIGFSQVTLPCTAPNPAVTAEELIAGHRELIRAAHARDLRIVGATLTPFKGAGYYTEPGEAVRDAVNDWIRTSGEYDAVADFDRALADPADPDRLRPEYDAGDGIHPSDTGFHAMAAVLDPAAP